MNKAIIFYQKPDIEVKNHVETEYICVECPNTEKDLILEYLKYFNLSQDFWYKFCLFPLELTNNLKFYLPKDITNVYIISKRKYNQELHDIISNMVHDGFKF